MQEEKIQGKSAKAKQATLKCLFALVTLCLAGTPAALAQQDEEQKGIEQGNYNIKQSIEFGGRFTNISGDPQAYNTFVNLQQGPRLLGFTPEMQSLNHHGAILDRFYFSNFGYGGDPNDVSRLRISKMTWYSFDALFRRDENFWDYSLQANPINPFTIPANAPAGFNPILGAPSNVLNTSILATSPHLFNTPRKLGDYSLLLLPDSNRSHGFQSTLPQRQTVDCQGLTSSRPLQSGGATSTLLAEDTTAPLMPDLSAEALAIDFILFVVFLFSTTCHEAAHALVAKLGGDETAFHGGQVTLNPVPHIQREPWGMVVIPILMLLLNGSIIGWASAPYDPHWERRHPHRAAWMALAGPATNYTLMLIAAIGLRAGWSQGWLHPKSFPETLLVALFSLNLLLGTFNLLPVTPLDGSTAIMLFMPEYRAQRYLDWLRGNQYGILGLVLAIFAFRYVYGPIEAFARDILLRSHF